LAALEYVAERFRTIYATTSRVLLGSDMNPRNMTLNASTRSSEQRVTATSSAAATLFRIASA
jgi:hypothetical protein